MSARDELAKLLAEAKYGADFDFEGRDNRSPAKYFTTKQADAILAAGYTKPRTITTDEELNALPNGATLKTLLRGKPVGRVWGKVEGTWWGLALEGPEYPILPAVVLHEPTA